MKSCLILGGSENVKEEAREALTLFMPDTTICINDIGSEYPTCDIWVSLHPEFFIEKKWVENRIKNNLPLPKHIISHRKTDVVTEIIDYRWQGVHGSGSSGLYAVKVALTKGYDRIVLAGVPIDPLPHFFDDKAWLDYKQFRNAWLGNKERLLPSVRSMSGFTRELLGYPDKQFLL